jgi:hypothetical protein
VKQKRRDGCEAHLVTLACSKPPEGRSKWTLRLLADQMVVMGHGGVHRHGLTHQTFRIRHRLADGNKPVAGQVLPVDQVEGKLEVFIRVPDHLPRPTAGAETNPMTGMGPAGAVDAGTDKRRSLDAERRAVAAILHPVGGTVTRLLVCFLPGMKTGFVQLYQTGPLTLLHDMEHLGQRPAATNQIEGKHDRLLAGVHTPTAYGVLRCDTEKEITFPNVFGHNYPLQTNTDVKTHNGLSPIAVFRCKSLKLPHEIRR